MKKFYYKKNIPQEETPILLKLGRRHTLMELANDDNEPNTLHMAARANSIHVPEELRSKTKGIKTQRKVSKSFSESGSSGIYSTASTLTITESDLASSWIYQSKKKEAAAAYNEAFEQASTDPIDSLPSRNSVKSTGLQDPLKTIPVPVASRPLSCQSCCCNLIVLLVISFCSLGIISAIGSIIYLELFAGYRRPNSGSLGKLPPANVGGETPSFPVHPKSNYSGSLLEPNIVDVYEYVTETNIQDIEGETASKKEEDLSNERFGNETVDQDYSYVLESLSPGFDDLAPKDIFLNPFAERGVNNHRILADPAGNNELDVDPSERKSEESKASVQQDSNSTDFMENNMQQVNANEAVLSVQKDKILPATENLSEDDLSAQGSDFNERSGNGNTFSNPDPEEQYENDSIVSSLNENHDRKNSRKSTVMSQDILTETPEVETIERRLENKTSLQNISQSSEEKENVNIIAAESNSRDGKISIFNDHQKSPPSDDTGNFIIENAVSEEPLLPQENSKIAAVENDEDLNQPISSANIVPAMPVELLRRIEMEKAKRPRNFDMKSSLADAVKHLQALDTEGLLPESRIKSSTTSRSERSSFTTKTPNEEDIEMERQRYLQKLRRIMFDQI